MTTNEHLVPLWKNFSDTASLWVSASSNPFPSIISGYTIQSILISNIWILKGERDWGYAGDCVLISLIPTLSGGNGDACIYAHTKYKKFIYGLLFNQNASRTIQICQSQDSKLWRPDVLMNQNLSIISRLLFLDGSWWVPDVFPTAVHTQIFSWMF